MEHESELLSLLDDLQEFERSFCAANQFNLFEAVNMVKSEIRHSRFLSFLLDPSRPHGLGDAFLKSIVLAAAGNVDNPPLSRLSISLADYQNARVYCERDHFDITVDVPELNILFVLENKIGAEERDNQLREYRETANRLYPEHIFFGCFLTPDGYSGEDPEWATLSYSDVIDSLKRARSNEDIKSGVKIAIDHYIELIERNIVPSKELIDACKRLYRQHKVAMDLIFEHGSDPLLSSAFQDFQNKHDYLSALTTTRRDTLSFVPTSWLAIEGFDVANTQRWDSKCPIKFWFSYEPKKIHLKLEVGPINSSEYQHFDRSEFLSRLRIALNSKETKRNSEIYTRVLSKSIKIEEAPSIEDVAMALEDLWKQFQGDLLITSVESVVKKYLADLAQ